MINANHHLSYLESAGLVRLLEVQPEISYFFRHALVQDAAYNSLLKADRSRLQQSVAETLERLYPERLDEIAPILAYHFERAGEQRRALKYFTLAGDVAFRTNANMEALSHYAGALAIARQQADFPAEQLLHLYNRHGRTLELTGQYPLAAANYQEMAGAAAERGDQVLALAALMARATIYIIPSDMFDPARGHALLAEALALARELADRPAETRILWNLMLYYFFTGQAQEGLAYGEAALALARDLGLSEQLGFILNDLAGYIYMALGLYERANTALAEAREIWQALNNKNMLADNLCVTAFNFHYTVGEYEQGLALVQEAYEISRSIHSVWGMGYSLALAGIFYLEYGQVQLAVESLRDGLRLAREAGFIAGQVIASSLLALQYGLVGHFEEALAVAQEAVALGETQIGFWLPLALGSQALIQIWSGNLETARATLARVPEDILQRDMVVTGSTVLMAECELALALEEYERLLTFLEPQIAYLRQRNVKGLLAAGLYYQGLACLGLGQKQAAKEALSEARTISERIKSRHWLWLVLAELGRLAIAEGNQEQGANWQQQAREVVDYLAGQMSPAMQESFFQLRQVKLLL